MVIENCYILVDCSVVTSHLDFVNGLLCGATDIVIKKSQQVQNAATRLVLKSDRYSS